MKKTQYGIGIFLGALTSVPLVVLSYLGDQLARLPFIPLNLYDYLTRAIPRLMVVLGIARLLEERSGGGATTPNLGAVSEVIQPTIIVAQLIILGVIFGAVLVAIGRRWKARRLPIVGLVIGDLLALAFVLIEFSLGFPAAGPVFSILWLILLFDAWGLVLGWLLKETIFAEGVTPEAGLSRREFLYVAGTGAVAALASVIGLGFLFGRRETRVAEGTPEATPPPVSPGGEGTPTPVGYPSEVALEERIMPAPGTRPEITSNENFYTIDISTRPPEIDGESWRLELTGLIDNPMMLTLEEIRARPVTSQYITLSCISNQVGGGLISTSLWTGTRLRDLLEEAGLQAGAQELYIEGADGFYESVSMEDMMDDRTLLVYEMNGEPLPVEHGFPLRIYIPNRFGMKQPKWITRMEVIDEEGPGYWVDRGWSAEAIARTTSVIDNVAVGEPDAETGEVPIGGIAWAGARGISKVEVQIDGGGWIEAELRVPPLSPLTWVQWRYDWSPEPGEHMVGVRAYDGSGDLQALEEQGRRPNGATGVDTVSFDV